MNSVRLALLGLTLVSPLVRAHVGSPNVFFQGLVGNYPTFAVFRPPAALPGAVQVSVRVEEPDVNAVALRPVLWPPGHSGEAATVTAQLVPGESNLWTATVWLLRPGSYTVQLKLDGPRGPGEVLVPVNVLSQLRQPMSGAVRVKLLLSGLCLFAGALLIVRGVARDGLVEGTTVLAASRRRANWAVAGMFLLLTAGLVAGAARWRQLELRHRSQASQRPEPVQTALRVGTNGLVLELQAAETASPTSLSWAALVPDHGKLIHLFLVRQPGLDAFAHLHPFRRDARRFELLLPRLPSGDYELYGDVTFENGMNQTLITRVSLPESAGEGLEFPPLMTNRAGEVYCGFPPGTATNGSPVVRDQEDSWHVSPGTDPPPGVKAGRKLVARLMGGYSLVWENPVAISNAEESLLRFAVFDAEGAEVVLQPYMGMRGHAAVRKADGAVFAHLHPSGSFSMASQAVFDPQQNAPADSSPSSPRTPSVGPAHRVEFPYEFPQRGRYRLWIQVRIAGRVLTGVFDLEVLRSR